MDIGNTIRELRLAKNLSQQKVADSLNVDRRTYAAWERGTKEMRIGFIPRLASFFEVEISYLFGRETKNSAKQSFEESPNSTIILILTDQKVADQIVDFIRKSNEGQCDLPL